MSDLSSPILVHYLENLLGLVVNADSDSFDLTGWHAVDATNFQCPKCDATAVILISIDSKSSLEGTCLICVNEKNVYWLDALSVKTRDAIKELFNKTISDPNRSNWPVEDLLKSLNRGNKSSAKSSNSAGSDDAGFAPKGYRHVAWLRLAEALSTLEAYKNRKTITTVYPEGNARGEARFYSEETSEAQKYLANVHVVRLRKAGERWVGWIRKEEAEAIVQAMESKSDISFAHIKDGKGGLVKYFPANSEMAEKYRSQTRLLRRS